MKLGDLKNGFELHCPTSGGKAGKGNNVTSTFQIRRGGFIHKQIRFDVNDKQSRAVALGKVRAFIETTTP